MYSLDKTLIHTLIQTFRLIKLSEIFFIKPCQFLKRSPIKLFNLFLSKQHAPKSRVSVNYAKRVSFNFYILFHEMFEFELKIMKGAMFD